jgi:hypothetical protein
MVFPQSSPHGFRIEKITNLGGLASNDHGFEKFAYSKQISGR